MKRPVSDPEGSKTVGAWRCCGCPKPRRWGEHKISLGAPALFARALCVSRTPFCSRRCRRGGSKAARPLHGGSMPAWRPPRGREGTVGPGHSALGRVSPLWPAAEMWVRGWARLGAGVCPVRTASTG